MKQPRCVAGFALTELAAAVAIVLVLAALLLVAAGESRRQSSLGDNLANLKQFAHGTGSFAADNDDRVWSFTGSIPQAAAQAWSIMRARSGLEAWLGAEPPSGWVPHIAYSHIVLADHLDTRLPERFTASPEDRLRLLWQSDPVGYESLVPDVQRPPGSGVAARRTVFSSSYELAPAFSARDARSLSPSGTTLSQTSGTSTNAFSVGSLPLGGRRLSEVAFPSQKVMVYEGYQRHFGPRHLLFMYEEARIPLMLADGSVAVRRTGDAGRGFEPNQPTSTTTTRLQYTPGGWEPPTASGQSSQLVTAHYRWTRSGLRGRDFGGPEIPWVD